jgi:hypothetical protein
MGILYCYIVFYYCTGTGSRRNIMTDRIYIRAVLDGFYSILATLSLERICGSDRTKQQQSRIFSPLFNIYVYVCILYKLISLRVDTVWFPTIRDRAGRCCCRLFFFLFLLFSFHHSSYNKNISSVAVRTAFEISLDETSLEAPGCAA